MYHLPAYVALERWAAGRRVLVVAPAGPEGPRRFVAAGARRVVAVGASGLLPIGVERADGVPNLPGVDGTVDLVACIEPYATMTADVRRRLVREAHRVLTAGGLFAAWIRQGEEDGLDFWGLEDEVGDVFGRVFMIAQMPWHGFSLAPVVESEVAPRVELLEGLLDDVPEATHYLAIAFRGAPSPALAAALVQECVLVPVPEPLGEPAGRVEDAQLAELRARADAAELQVVAQQDALAEARTRADAAEQQVAALQDRVDTAAAEVAMADERRQKAESRADALRAQLDDLAAQTTAAHAQLDSEREAATHQLHEQQGQSAAQLRTLQDELARARTEADDARRHRDDAEQALRTKQTDLKVLSATVRDLEQSLSRVSERAESRARDLDARQREIEEIGKRRDALVAERDHLTHQIEVAIAEREGARQLLARVEAELELSRRKVTEQQDRIAAKVEEASRLAGEIQALRERIDHQQTLLDHSRTRAEELSATAAKRDEQGRMLAEVAIDRDRLREELTRRAQQIQELEERVWTAREDVQKERLENVRLAGELERLREQATRSREVEALIAKQLEATSAELAASERARQELSAQVRAREEEIARLRRDADTLTSASADVQSLQQDLQTRGREIDELQNELQSLRAREQEAAALARRREEQLSVAGTELERMRQATAEQTGVTAALQGEIDVKSLEVEQLAAAVADLQAQLDAARSGHQALQAANDDAQRRLEEAVAEQDMLRRNLRARDQELQDVVSANETSGVELYKLRRELEAASQSNEQLEDVLRGQVGEAWLGEIDVTQWPEEAVAEVQRLRAQLSAQSRRHAEQVARIEPGDPGSDTMQDRMRTFRLEAQVRAEEQEVLLGLLESAEQKIWEMNDASDRNAARLAASLAQLEKHKELLDETMEELEVHRKLLGASQARALEQERLLASERAKLARAGIGLDGLPPGVQGGRGVEEVFAELDRGSGLIELGAIDTAAPQVITSDATTTVLETSPDLARADAPRVLVEPLNDDDPWPEDDREAPSTPRAPVIVPVVPKRSTVLPPAPTVPGATPIKRAGGGTGLKAVPSPRSDDSGSDEP